MGRHRRSARRLAGLGGLTLLLALLLLPSAASAQRRLPPATTSSPIALSDDGRYVWNVNQRADIVTVIRAGSGDIVRRINTGDEPAAVALHPNGRYAYVVNPAENRLSVIRITDLRPFRTTISERVTTGAEPWNVVVSPDGKRVFVANAGQDTVTVLTRTGRIIGNINLGRGVCVGPDAERLFQPRGLAVTRDSNKLFVTSFLAYTRPGGRQATDDGKEGVVCRVNIDTDSSRIGNYRPAQRITFGARPTGFAVDSNGDATPDPTVGYPNQLQSIVIRGNYAFLPNIAASPAGPIRFNVNTQAFVNVLGGVTANRQTDASDGKFLNLHLGARTPETGKKKLFFAGPWAIGFTSRSGSGQAYVVAQNSDLLVKVNVAANGTLSFTGGEQTTRYIDLNDPANPATSGDNAGKNPLGIVVNEAGTRAWVVNSVSRNVTKVDLRNDRVERVIRTAPLPPPGSAAEKTTVGAEVFFSSRGNFDRPANTAPTTSTTDRLSSEGWQACSSCHFEGLTDGNVWSFAAGPRRSIPLNATFNPADRTQRRTLNYSAIRDEPEDFEENTRNVSGPGPLVAAVTCNAPAAGAPATGTLDPNHGMLIGDNGDINVAPCILNNFNKPNGGRPQLTVTLPGAGRQPIPAWSAMTEWIRLAVRTPNKPYNVLSTRRNRPGRPGLNPALVNQGRALFVSAGCVDCHVGGAWTIAINDQPLPPPLAELPTERVPPQLFGNPVGAQMLAKFLRNVDSFNIGVPGAGNEMGNNIGGTEKAAPPLPPGAAAPAGVAQDALGIDYNGDGKGIGYAPPSLLGLNVLPPFYHNGACETLACVVNDPKHRGRAGNGQPRPDGLPEARQRQAVTEFLKSIDAKTRPLP